jgi:DNA-binding SARP family transcriptional activator
MQEKIPLKVQMLGDFALHFGTETILSGYSRSNKVIYLLQYLLVHRQRNFSRDALIQLLYGREDTENPVNALKITIHRLRKLLASACPENREYILYDSGRYGWNNAIPCEVDVELFDTAIQQAESMKDSPEEQLRLYKKAIDLYNGEFLPALSTEDWVAPLTMYYQQQYRNCVQNTLHLMEEQGDMEGMLTVGRHAAALFPYDEDMQILKIYCLYKCKQIKEAIATYNETVEMLFNEYGVSPSKELIDIYKEVSAGMPENRDSVVQIRDTIRENEEERGAYYTNFQNFVDSYHLIVRNLERTGLSAYLMLCTLEDQGDFDHLKTAIKDSLRKGDCFTRYSARQYLILLTGISYENCEVVFHRIEDKFRRYCRGRCYKLGYSVASAVDTSWIDRKVV